MLLSHSLGCTISKHTFVRVYICYLEWPSLKSAFQTTHKGCLCLTNVSEACRGKYRLEVYRITARDYDCTQAQADDCYY